MAELVLLHREQAQHLGSCAIGSAARFFNRKQASVCLEAKKNRQLLPNPKNDDDYSFQCDGAIINRPQLTLYDYDGSDSWKERMALKEEEEEEEEEEEGKRHDELVQSTEEKEEQKRALCINREWNHYWANGSINDCCNVIFWHKNTVYYLDESAYCCLDGIHDLASDYISYDRVFRACPVDCSHVTSRLLLNSSYIDNQLHHRPSTLFRTDSSSNRPSSIEEAVVVSNNQERPLTDADVIIDKTLLGRSFTDSNIVTMPVESDAHHRVLVGFVENNQLFSQSLSIEIVLGSLSIPRALPLLNRSRSVLR